MITVDHHHHLSTPAFVSKFKNILTARDVDLALIAIVQCAALTDVMRASKIKVSKMYGIIVIMPLVILCCRTAHASYYYYLHDN